MKALVGAFNQEKALVGAFSVIVQPVVEPMDRFAALLWTISSITARAALQPSPALQQLHVDLQLCPRLLLVQPVLVLQISGP